MADAAGTTVTDQAHNDVTQTDTATSSQEVAEFLKFLRTEAQSGVADTKVFVGQQAPLVVQELIVYERATATAFLMLPLILTVLMGLCWKWFMTTKDRDAGDMMGPLLLGTVLVGILWIVATPSAFKAWFAPRLVVLGYLKDLL